MERSMSVEDKIRRAEEIYARRHEHEPKHMATVSVNEKKDIKLLKKMIIQIVACLCIYLIIHTIQSGNYIFSEDFMNKAREILSYDINFEEMYDNFSNIFINITNQSNENVNDKSDDNTNDNENTEIIPPQEDGIGGADETVNSEQSNETNLENAQLSQVEQDIINIKNTTTFIKPVDGTVSSKYGQREPTTSTVPKNHTGTDIAANMGTKIKSATDGEVVLVSSEGDYGNHLKVQIGEVSIIYAHCNSIYVKEGDKITQGQEIAEVGSTGNSTGPHLHFEVRISERTVDPQSILEL